MSLIKRVSSEARVEAARIIFYSRLLQLRRLPRFDPHERMIGIMMIRNENDVLRETLKNVTAFYDRIFILDGTEPEEEFLVGRRIMDEFEEVKLVIRDADTKGPFPIRDGARFYLLEEVRKRYGVNNWIGVLHGDEIYTRDPRPFLKMINPYFTPVVTVRLCHFFPHTSDREKWPEIAAKPVEDRLTHYMWPGDSEDRFFFDTGKFQYEPALHSLVVPYMYILALKKHLDNFVIKQYNCRTPEQMHARAAQRIGSNWQKNHYEHITKEDLLFVDSLNVPGYDPCGPDNLLVADQSKWSKPKSMKNDPLLSCRPMARPVFVGGIGAAEAEHVMSFLCEHQGLAAVRQNTEFLTGENGLIELLGETHKSGYGRLLKTLSDKKEIVSTLQALGERSCRQELEHLARLLSDSAGSWRDKKSAIRNLVHFLFDRFALAEDAAGWIEHSPNNIFRVNRLLEVFEDGNFIFVRRDPEDFVRDITQGAAQSEDEAFDLYNRRYDRWKKSRAMITSCAAEDRVIEISYKDVISSRGSCVMHILDRIGIRADAALSANT